MSIIGKSLAHYEITDQIGKGGMGEVYRAKDTKLGRDVAIKVLPEEFARDYDRVTRFQREAKLLASLNHPNIAAIHGLEDLDGTHFLVMELIEGDTLTDRIKKGPVPVEEALKLAIQIAEALEAAHDKGVIHRDLKPSNIKITPEGKVKVLDFGLAKAFTGETAGAELSNSPTLSDAATRQGVILGTAAYMSPEQATGKSVDKRADIWAFGVVLFEMLTGKKLFEGDTVTETIAGVIKGEPAWKSLPPELHPRIRFMLERCLKKVPKNRYSGISDARVDIQEVLSDTDGVFVHSIQAAEPQKKSKQVIIWVGVTIILLIIVGIVTWYTKAPETRQVMRADYLLPEDQRLSTYPFPFNISPDGKHIVYGTQKGLYLRPIDELNAKPIAGSDEITESPFFSPDGKTIVYGSPGYQKLKKISIDGGASVDLCNLEPIRGISWKEDDYIVYGTFTGSIIRVSSKGGDPKTLFALKSGIPVFPVILPDKNLLIYTNAGLDGNNPVITAKRLDSDEPIELFSGRFVRYLPSGHMVYLDVEGNLCAVPFDLDNLEAVGEYVPMIPGVDDVAISDSGTLLYTLQTPQEEAPKLTLVWVDKEGKEEPIEAPPNDYYSLKISPDGKQIASVIGSDITDSPIFIYDILRGTMKKLTIDVPRALQPIWFPTGEKIIYWSPDEGTAQGSIFWRSADGSGQIEKLISDSTRQLLPWSISADGKTLLMQELLSMSNADVGALSLENDFERKPLLQNQYSEAQPAISPDGKLLAYVSNESTGEVEQSELFIRPYPEVDKGKEQVSNGGGVCPLWSPDGKELYYLTPDNDVMVVSVETEPKLNLGTPELLFRNNNQGFIFGRGYPWDIHPNGDRFLMIKPPAGLSASAATGPRKITIVLNWDEELKQRVPVD